MNDVGRVVAVRHSSTFAPLSLSSSSWLITAFLFYVWSIFFFAPSFGSRLCMCERIHRILLRKQNTRLKLAGTKNSNNSPLPIQLVYIFILMVENEDRILRYTATKCLNSMPTWWFADWLIFFSSFSLLFTFSPFGIRQRRFSLVFWIFRFSQRHFSGFKVSECFPSPDARMYFYPNRAYLYGWIMDFLHDDLFICEWMNWSNGGKPIFLLWWNGGIGPSSLLPVDCCVMCVCRKWTVEHSSNRRWKLMFQLGIFFRIIHAGGICCYLWLVPQVQIMALAKIAE